MGLPQREPYKTISALELLGTTIGVTVIPKEIGELGDSDGLVRITGHTDSQVSANVVS